MLAPPPLAGRVADAVVLLTHACHGGDNPLQKATRELGWYSHVVYARPDVRYTTPLDVASIFDSTQH